VAAVAIRHLSPTQAVLAGALQTAAAGADATRTTEVRQHRWLRAPDGAGLWRLLHEAELV
jgi:hypothetical protein